MSIEEKYNELVKKLHSECKHPDYEYTSTEAPRKCGYEVFPEGIGWEDNVDKDYGVTRYDVVEHQHYRRLKTFALMENISPFSKPPVTLKGIIKADLFVMLAERLNDHYMPIKSTAMGCLLEIKNRPEFNSKPRYIDHGNVYNNLEPGCNTISKTTIFDVLDYSIPGALGYVFREDTIYYFIELNDFEIIVNLSDYDKETFVRTKRKDGNWGNFEVWPTFVTLNINKYDLKEYILNN